MLNRILVTVGMWLVAGALPLNGQELPSAQPARYETVQRLLVATKTAAYHEEILRQIVGRYDQVPVPTSFIDVAKGFLEKYVSYAAIEPELIAVYQEHLSEEEVLELIRFWESPVGQRVATIMPILSAKAAEIGSRRILEVLPQLMVELRKRGGGNPEGSYY